MAALAGVNDRADVTDANYSLLEERVTRLVIEGKIQRRLIRYLPLRVTNKWKLSVGPFHSA